MNRALIHRGPDDEGIYLDENICLGHRRLSIIDLSRTAHQPLTNEDESVWLVFNGEIYNYKALRRDLKNKGHVFKSDTDGEVIVHLYEEYGSDCVKYMLGMFAFAVWDKKKQILMLARDRLGKKPLLYYYENGSFCFASEFSGLLESGLIKKDINTRALDYYFTLGYIPAPFSIYNNVFKLMPAHTLLFDKNGLRTQEYWHLDFEKKARISFPEAEERLIELMSDAVSVRLHSDVPLGVFLSGGIDSSMITALMSKVRGKKIKTFSIGFGESDYNELKYARNIAKYFDTEHYEFTVKPDAAQILPLLIKHYGEPYADPSSIPTYYVANISRKHVTVALNGDGGDEAFAGYERYQAMIYSRIVDIMPVYLRRAAAGIFRGCFAGTLDSQKFLSKLKRFFEGLPLERHKRYMKLIGVFDDSLKSYAYSKDFIGRIAAYRTDNSFKECISGEGRLNLLDRLLKLDTLTYLPDDLLAKVDIASMANSLEARSPFLDHRLMEFAASLPPDFKIRNFTKKYIFKKVSLRFIPKENVERVKRGFGVPVAQWLRGELKDLLCDNLLNPAFFSRGYFNEEAVCEMIKLHLANKMDYGFQLWTILMFELWFQRFMDNK